MRNYVTSCDMCKYTSVYEASDDQMERWIGGEPIQTALPQLNVTEREMLISGICGDCFDSLFNVQED